MVQSAVVEACGETDREIKRFAGSGVRRSGADEWSAAAAAGAAGDGADGDRRQQTQVNPTAPAPPQPVQNDTTGTPGLPQAPQPKLTEPLYLRDTGDGLHAVRITSSRIR